MQLRSFTVFVACAVGCAPAVGADANVDAQDASTDIRFADAADAADATTSRPLFSECTSNAQCGARARCMLEYAGGLCTRACSNDSQCEGGVCIASTCLPGCTLGGGECSPSRVCVFESSSRLQRRACLPSCATPPPAGEPSCTAGRQCNPYTRFGECTTFTHDPNLGENGAPCREDGDCRGVCITEEFDGLPTGWIDGYCESFGRVPDPALYGPRIPLPRSNCPAGSVLVPAESQANEGDWGECFKECRADSDCRLNYRCLFFEYRGGGRSATGYCSAFNCLFARFSSEPNNGCAPGFRCERLDEPQPSGMCVRDGDAGADAASPDATSTDAADSAADAGAAPDVADAATIDSGIAIDP